MSIKKNLTHKTAFEAKHLNSIAILYQHSKEFADFLDGLKRLAQNRQDEALNADPDRPGNNGVASGRALELFDLINRIENSPELVRKQR